MPADCPFCGKPVVPNALVCSSCAREITIPETLLAERDDLIRKRALAREELAQAKAALEALRRRHRISLRRS
jgi:predicted amidophosphoribosyltransferase